VGSATTAGSLSTASVTATSTTTSNTSFGLSSGAAAGIGVAFLVLLAGILIFIRRRRARPKALQPRIVHEAGVGKEEGRDEMAENLKNPMYEMHAPPTEIDGASRS
jgi:flagellar biosynthesis/type III secretory pathway M-ring protein FliF/YscJ